MTKHRFEEHTRGRVLVVLQKFRNIPCTEDPWVVTVKAKLVILLLNARVQAPTVSAEADTKQELILCRVPEQETSLGLFFQKLLCLISVNFAPVEGAACDLFEVGHQMVDIVNLSVRPGVKAHLGHHLLGHQDVLLPLLQLLHHLLWPFPPPILSSTEHTSPLSGWSYSFPKRLYKT